ncbi:hypothetical protein TWF481_002219 [Arthrobotrys musiformis]|uniref:Uncharacterized protein n=1 Tax=Arthrobotrys musiformis TaxID=47236 RepID=A0AAV9VYM9_9PEZI
MAKYQLQLVNQSGAAQRFYFLTAPPTFHPEEVYSTPWLSILVQDGFTTNVSINMDFYAFFSQKEVVDGKSKISSGNPRPEPAKLGVGDTKGSSYKIYWDRSKENFRWDDTPHENNAYPKCFSIFTRPGFSQDDNLMIGVAMLKDGSEYASPVAVLDARPALTYNIAPVPTFYVSAGDKREGDLFDFSPDKIKSGVYDFSANSRGQGYTAGTLTYTGDSLWTQAEYIYPTTGLSAPTCSHNC